MANEEFRVRFGKALMEFIGTAVILFSVQITFQTHPGVAPWIVALIIIALIYAGAPISGAHYNPAVTICVFFRGRFTMHETILYWITQLIGALFGSFFGALFVGKALYIHPGNSYSLSQALVAELVFTTLLCFVAIAAITSDSTDGNSYFGGKSTRKSCMRDIM